MSNYFEKYIKYKKKYSLINLKSSGGSNTAVESDGLLIAKEIQQNIMDEIKLFSRPNNKMNNQLSTLLTAEKILEIAQIPPLFDVCNIASGQNPGANALSMVCIKRHVLPFIINPKIYYQSILTFLSIDHTDLYSYYKTESDKINLDHIINKLGPYLLPSFAPGNESIQHLSIDLFYIKDTNLIAEKLFEFLVKYNSTRAYIGFGGIPRSVTLTVILLLSYLSNYDLRSHETFIAVTQRMVEIIIHIRGHINTNTSLSADLKGRYIDSFPDNDRDIRQMYL